MSEATHRMLRVDQAGEYGATRIYAGQLAVMGNRAAHSPDIAAMAAQEAEHRARFDALMAARGVRPTALQPVWHIAGFALGAATALIGPEAAMACTAAVEAEIDRHYTRQLEDLGDSDPELSEIIDEFRAEEREPARHREGIVAHVQATCASARQPVPARRCGAAFPARSRAGSR
jgi:ubiquinone biosynthesis monooxygenase Coq7